MSIAIVRGKPYASMCTASEDLNSSGKMEPPPQPVLRSYPFGGQQPYLKIEPKVSSIKFEKNTREKINIYIQK